MTFQQKLILKCGILPLLMMALTSPCASAGDVLKFGGPENSFPQFSFDEVNHAQFNALLRHYVDHRGKVCYRKWAKNGCDINRLQAYLFHLAQIDPSRQSSHEATLSYYINAYNALTLWGILDNYPVASIHKLDGEKSRYDIFDDLRLWIGDRHLSLNELENGVIRPMGDPRIHFALVCAARGCPRLRNEAYVSQFVDRQLTDNAIEFFSDRTRFHIAQFTGNVKISPILKWYREDFGNTDHEVISSVFRYLPTEDRYWLSTNPGWKLSHLGYDWGLNDGCPTIPVALGKIPYKAYSKVSPFIAPLLPSNPEDAAINESKSHDNLPSPETASSPPVPAQDLTLDFVPERTLVPDLDLE